MIRLARSTEIGRGLGLSTDAIGSHRGLRAGLYEHLARCQNESLPNAVNREKSLGDTVEKYRQEKPGMSKAKFSLTKKAK